MSAPTPTNLEIYTEGDFAYLKLSDDAGEREISVAMTAEQAYAVALGILGAVKHLKEPGSPLAVKEGETVH